MVIACKKSAMAGQSGLPIFIRNGLLWHRYSNDGIKKHSHCEQS